jgi:hypothetical protein
MDPSVKKMALIESEPVSVSHQFQSSFPRETPVEKVTKIFRSPSDLFGF